MNGRIQQFLAAENISQSQFAQTIGVARASVSHVLSGRNKPSFDFIERMCVHYPALSIEWLISGKGRMFKSPVFGESGRSVYVSEAPGDLFPASEDIGIVGDEVEFSSQIPVQSIEDRSAEIESKTLSEKLYHSTNQRGIRKIIVFFDDDTFQEIA